MSPITPSASRAQRRTRAEAAQNRPRTRQRRTVSCLPCRLHKLRCDQGIPCQSCCRYRREDQCRRNPPPGAVQTEENEKASTPSTVVLPRPGTGADRSVFQNGSMLDFPPSPLSVVTVDARQDLPSQHVRYLNQPDGRLAGFMADVSQYRHYPARETNGLGVSQDVSRSKVFDQPQEVMSIASLTLRNPSSARMCTLLDEQPMYWKQYLTSLLPTQTQSDILVSYFFENINWVYQAIHAPSFRTEYAGFWSLDVSEIDLIWLALLYMMLCMSALYIPSEMAEAAGFDVSELGVLSRRWYAASRQALQSGGYDCKPTVTQIQVFLISQLYLYGTKNVEALNSHLGQAVRNAQALGLDKETPPTVTDCLEREMRHRLWWDLVSSDTFQSLCLGRPPLLQSHLSTVPFPSNCNDVDITTTSINIRPESEPTEMSMHQCRARIFKVFNRLYNDGGVHLSSYNFVSDIDAEITSILDSVPWFFALPQESEPSPDSRLPSSFSFIPWGYHILHSCVYVQRLRMYRPFLHPLVGDSWQRCLDAASSALVVYRDLRSQDVPRFQRSHKMRVQAYQIVSAAMVLATFLLVERPPDPDRIRSDVDMVMSDLQSFASNSTESDTRSVPLVTDGLKVLQRILMLYDARCNTSGRSSNCQRNSDPPTSLAPAISSVFGGETSARKYLERCAIEYIINDNMTDQNANMNASGMGHFDSSTWGALLDVPFSGEWGDSFWTELESAVGSVG